jgi:integrase
VIVQRTWSRQRLGPTKTGRRREVSFLHPMTEDSPDWQPGVTAGSRGVLTALRRPTVPPLIPSGFLFGSGSEPLSSSVVNADWRRILRAAGVRYRCPEQLRHTFASTMLSRNAPLLYVQQQGGWSSAAVLLRVYARRMPQGFGAIAEHVAATPAQHAVAAIAVTS